MSQVSQQLRFVSSKPTHEIIELAAEILSKHGGKLSRQPNSVFTDLATDFGSQLKLRLLGGMFLSNEALPTRVAIEVQDGSENRRVFVTAEDRIGFGTTAGLGDRYKAWCGQLAERVRDDLQYRLGESPTKNG